ncbi:MAG TPA: hypothetical protein VII94_01770 [Candidatus Saccharimonadales bacterium]
MNKKILLLVLSIFAVILLIFFALSFNRGFRITGFSPSLKNISTVTPYFDIEFSEPISLKGLFIYSSQNIISSYKVNGIKNIRVYLNIPLDTSINYQIIIRNVSNKNSESIKDQTVSFRAVYTPSGLLPKAQVKYLTSTQDKSVSQTYGTALVNSLPYLSPGNEFLVDYGIVNSVPRITVTSASSQGYTDANTWITTQGYNLSALNIKYISQQP